MQFHGNTVTGIIADCHLPFILAEVACRHNMPQAQDSADWLRFFAFLIYPQHKTN